MIYSNSCFSDGSIFFREGHITHSQCAQALATLGIPETCHVTFTRSDEDVGEEEDMLLGTDVEFVSKESFLKLAKIGLAKATSTFVS